MTKIRKEMTEEEIISKELKTLRNRFIPEPTRFFSIGDEVVIGNIKKSVVEHIFDKGKFYVLRQISVNNNYGKEIESERVGVWEWTSCIPIETNNVKENLYKEDSLRISFSQRDISGLLHCHYHFGIDDTMDYQRELVWDLEDKQSLIDSIFNNIEIGKFCLINLDYKKDSPGYEILDGKQRLNALKEFFESRFAYKGKYYHELSRRDRGHFKSYSVSWGEANNITEKQKYEYFIKLNTSGKPQDIKHLEKVKELLEGERYEI